MDVKRFFRLTQFKYIALVLLPLIFGGVYSLYKFDSLHWGVSTIFFLALPIFLMGVNLLKELTIYRYADTDEKMEETHVVQWDIDLDKLRRFMWIFLVMGILLMGLSALISDVKAFIFIGIIIILSILYVIGPKPIMNTFLSEVIFSFGLGFLVPLTMIYMNTYYEQLSMLDFIMEILWVTLPFVLLYQLFMFGYHLGQIQQGKCEQTLTAYMTVSVTEGVMELLLFLAFLLPFFSIYLDYVSWTILLVWIIFPKLWLDMKKFESENNKAKYFPYIREIVVVATEFQILLYTLGLFF